jgi:hypothetical protein
VDETPVMMDFMSSDPHPSTPSPAPPPQVVEIGTEPGERPAGRRRWSATEIATSLAADRRAVPLSAAVGAVALFASLISEWQITLVDTSRFADGETGIRPLPVGVADLGALGAGFLAGVFLLATAVVLVLFGPPAGRGYARLIGLSTGGVLLALLAALASSLGDSTRAIEGIFVLQFDPDQLQLAYGRGIWCAFFGVAAVLLALHLSARHAPAVRPAVEPDSPDEIAEPPAVWSWRRPRTAADDRPPDEPFDLTVTSTRPFTSLSDDRDKPTERGESGRGISG